MKARVNARTASARVDIIRVVLCVLLVWGGDVMANTRAHAVVNQAYPFVEGIPFAFIDAAVMHDVPPVLLFAVALTESVDYEHEFVNREVGRRAWPWTLNVKGQGFKYASREEACIALEAKLKDTRLIDVGIAQLNIRWNPDLFAREGRFPHPCDALDPYANLEESARLLSKHFRTTGDWLVAAGRYHRPAGGQPAERYQHSVEREIQRIIDNQTVASR